MPRTLVEKEHAYLDGDERRLAQAFGVSVAGDGVADLVPRAAGVRRFPAEPLQESPDNLLLDPHLHLEQRFEQFDLTDQKGSMRLQLLENLEHPVIAHGD